MPQMERENTHAPSGERTIATMAVSASTGRHVNNGPCHQAATFGIGTAAILVVVVRFIGEWTLGELPRLYGILGHWQSAGSSRLAARSLLECLLSFLIPRSEVSSQTKIQVRNHLLQVSIHLHLGRWEGG